MNLGQESPRRPNFTRHANVRLVPCDFNFTAAFDICFAFRMESASVINHTRQDHFHGTLYFRIYFTKLMNQDHCIARLNYSYYPTLKEKEVYQLFVVSQNMNHASNSHLLRFDFQSGKKKLKLKLQEQEKTNKKSVQKGTVETGRFTSSQYK